MTFNSGEYRKRVVTMYAHTKQPLLHAALRDLSDGKKVPSNLDLLELYEIDPRWSDAQIAEQVANVANDLNKIAASSLGFKAIGHNLVNLHKKLAHANPGLATSAFWTAQSKKRDEARQDSLSDFGKAAAAELGPLGAITAQHLRELARRSRVPEKIGEADLAKYITASGGIVVPAVPEVTAPAQALKEIGYGVATTASRSVLSAIFLKHVHKDKKPEPERFSLLDGFHVPVPGSPPLSLKTVAESLTYSKEMRDSNLSSELGKVLSTIQGAAPSDDALHQLVICAFIDVAKQITSEFPLQLQALRAFMERTGIEEMDAKRILLHVLGGKAQTPGGYREVEAKIAKGALKHARRAYDAMRAATKGSSSPEEARTLAALQEAEQRVERLRATARDAVESGDIETAQKALRNALTICTDDAELEETARRLPPAAPIRLVAAATEEGQFVRLSWEPGFSDTGDVQYQIVRKIGAAPANNRDGSEVGKAISESAFVDAQPSVAAVLHYGVSATRGDGYSPVATASIRLLPPVRDVRVSSDPASVGLRWTTPVGARAVELCQVAPDGRRTLIPVGTQSGATSGGLTMGATYTYLLTAVYTGQDGAELRSEAVRVIGVPRGVADVVASLSLANCTSNSSAPEIEASWQGIPGYQVEVWHFAQRPAWALSTRVPMANVRSLGTQLAGRETSGGASQGVRGSAGSGLRYYVAITRDGDEALIGQVQPFGICPPVTDVVAERFNEEVQLRWNWPGNEFDVLVRWTGAAGSGEKVVMRSDYLKEGCRIRTGTGGAVFTLSTIAGQADGEWASPQTRVEIVPASAAVHYEIQVHRSFFRSPKSATLRFSGAAIGNLEVVVVGAFSRIMPHDESQGTVLVRASVNPAANPTFDVALPSGSGPLWIRAFSSTPGLRLVDPPSFQMRVE